MHDSLMLLDSMNKFTQNTDNSLLKLINLGFLKYMLFQLAHKFGKFVNQEME